MYNVWAYKKRERERTRGKGGERKRENNTTAGHTCQQSRWAPFTQHCLWCLWETTRQIVQLGQCYCFSDYEVKETGLCRFLLWLLSGHSQGESYPVWLLSEPSPLFSLECDQEKSLLLKKACLQQDWTDKVDTHVPILKWPHCICYKPKPGTFQSDDKDKRLERGWFNSNSEYSFYNMSIFLQVEMWYF